LFKTLKTKFIFVTIIFIMLSVGIPTFFLLIQFKKNFQQRSESMLKTTLAIVNNGILSEMMQDGKHKNFLDILARISSNEGVDYIRIFNKSGIITYSSDVDEIGTNISETAPDHINDSGSERTSIKIINERKVYSVAKPIKNEKSCISCHDEENIIAYLDVDMQLTPAEVAFYTGSVHIVLLSVLVMLILAGGFYFLFNFFINAPLTRFTIALDSVNTGNLDMNLPAAKDDEFGTIEKHFNQMVRHLRKSQKKIDQMHFEQLQRADKMVTLGELAAEMAHEINNPAGIIMSRMDYLMLEAEDNKFLKNYYEDYEVVQNQIGKVSKITGNILKYSKKLPKNIKAINLGQLVENSIAVIKPRLEKNKIKIKQEYVCEANCDRARILGDPQQIEQIIINILNNAVDSITKNGEIFVGVKCLTDSVKQLTFSDTGRGMTEEVRSQIFSPFFTTKSVDKGTGLGLYIVKKICDNHNAEISCFSEESRGTTFIITFLGKRENI